MKRREDKPGEIIKVIDKVLNLEPDNIDAAALKLDLLLQIGHSEQALELFNNYSTSTKSNRIDFLQRAFSAFHAHKCNSEAVRVAEELVRLQPNNPEFQVYRAQSRKRNQQFEKSFDEISKGLLANPQNHQLCNEFADLLADIARPFEAVKYAMQYA